MQTENIECSCHESFKIIWWGKLTNTSVTHSHLSTSHQQQTWCPKAETVVFRNSSLFLKLYHYYGMQVSVGRVWFIMWKCQTLYSRSFISTW
jgi:hypothetical protein